MSRLRVSAKWRLLALIGQAIAGHNGGVRTAIYSNSLMIVMALVFFASWFGQSVTGWTDFNQEQPLHDATGQEG